MLRSGQVWYGMVVTRDATGAIAAAGAGPTGTLYVNGVANAAAVVIAGVNPYSWTVTLPAIAAGGCVSMYVTATVGGIATGSVVCEDVVDTIRLSDGVTVTAINNNVITAASIATDAIDADAIAANAITAAEIATGAIDADAISADAGLELADAVLDEAVDGAYTLRGLIRIMAAALAGLVSGGGTTTVVFRDVNDTTNRITATVDASGNRTAITLDAT